MIKKITFGLILFLTTGAITLSCSSSKLVREEKDRVIAKVNGDVIFLKSLQNKLDELKYRSTSPEQDLEEKREALDGLIDDQIIKQNALEMDLSQDSSFHQEKEEHMKGFLLSLLYRNEITQQISVSDQEIEQFYWEHPNEYYIVPERAKVSRILIKIDCPIGSPDCPRAEQEALDRISMIRQRIINGEDFEKLARELSEDEWSAKRNGNLGYVRRTSFIPEFEDFVFTANLNELSQPIRSSEGWNLLIVRDKIEGQKSELNQEARERTREYLKKEKQKLNAVEYVENLKDKNNFIFNDYALSRPDSLVLDNPWVLIINHQDTISYELYHYMWDFYKSDIEDDSLLLEYKKRILLNSPMVVNPLLRQEAKDKGYLNLPEYREEEKKFTCNWVEDKVKTELDNKIETYQPTDEEIYDYYLTHGESYPQDSSIHVYQILFEDSLLAEKIREEIIRGADFVEMAEKYHTKIGINGNTSYDLGFISDQSIPEEFYRAAVLLQEGEVSQVVRTELGYHLLKLVERRSSPLDPYKPGIRIKLTLQKAQQLKKEWKEKLRKGSEIWVDQELLKSVKLKQK